MQAAKDVDKARGRLFRKCGKLAQQGLTFMLRCYGYLNLSRSYSCLERRAPSSIDVYLVSPRAAAIRLAGAISTPYTLGIHVARLRGSAVLPMLGLLSLSHRHRLKPSTHYVVVDDEAAIRFIYGKDVELRAVLEERVEQQCRLPVIVVNKLYEPLGYGKKAKSHGELLIRNVLDAGWYLRSGV